jgi:pentatricopeptide repeat protein
LKTCGNTGAIDKGEAIHHEVMNKNWLEKDIAIGNALVDMYIKCGVFAKARNVFEALPARDLITWNVLIGGYAQHGAVCEAISCLERMQSEGLCPDAVTFTCTLKACASAGDIDKGREIHEQILGGDLHEKDLVLGNALVDMYAKCGAFSKAQELLEGLPARDVITWNALISGYSQYGHFQEVLECLEKMRGEGIASDVITHICVLKACACMGAIDKGIETHDEIARTLLEEDIVLGNALADMYVKCGVIARALEVLEELPIRDVTSWNTLIAGYAERGQGQEAFDCFQCMLVEGVRGDEITFLSVLSACGHAGLLDEVRMLFGNMSSEHSITPKLGHHACMVIAFGCAGYFDEAVSVIKAMPSSDFPEIWLVLLSVCAKWGNVELGRLAFDQLVQLDRGSGAAYVLMANVFASAGLQEDANAMDAMEVKYACADKSRQGVQIDAYGRILANSFSSEYRTSSS